METAQLVAFEVYNLAQSRKSGEVGGRGGRGEVAGEKGGRGEVYACRLTSETHFVCSLHLYSGEVGGEEGYR